MFANTSSIDALEGNSPKMALALCQKQLKKTPGASLVLALQAFSLTHIGKLSEAGHIVDKLLQQKPADPSALSALAMTLKRLHRGKCH